MYVLISGRRRRGAGGRARRLLDGGFGRSDERRARAGRRRAKLCVRSGRGIMTARRIALGVGVSVCGGLIAVVLVSSMGGIAAGGW